MKIKSLAAALLVPMLFACNSQADRQALKEELKAETPGRTDSQGERKTEGRTQRGQGKGQRRPGCSLQAKAEAKVAKQRAAQAKPAPRVTPTSMNLTHVKISDLRGYTNLRNSPGGAVCMRLYANMDYDIYVNGISNGWYNIAEIYRPDGSRVRLHSSNTGWWIHRSICYTVN